MIFKPPWLETTLRELGQAPGVRLKELRGGSMPFIVGLLAKHFPVALVLNDHGKIFSTADEIGAWYGRSRVFATPPRGDPLLPWPHSEDADHPERYRAMAALDDPQQLADAVFILSPATLIQRIGARIPAGIDISEGAEFEREELASRLIECGYQPSTAAYEAGEFALRGGIIDVFPPDGSPIRVELDDDVIGRLRYYNPATQRSTGPAQHANIKPMAEVPLDEENRIKAAKRIEHAFQLKSTGEVAERIRTGTAFKEDLSRYLPFFWEKPVSILDRLSPETVVILEDGGVLNDLVTSVWDKLLREHSTHPARDKLAEPSTSYMTPDELENVLSGVNVVELGAPGIPGREKWPVIAVGAEDNDEISTAIRESLKVEDGSETSEKPRSALDPLLIRIDKWRALGYRVVLTSPDGISAARFEALLREYGEEVNVTALPEGLLDNAPSRDTLTLALAPLSKGFCMAETGWAVVTEEEIFGQKIRRRRPSEAPPADRLEDLRPSDTIVHVDHGIGIFRGMEKLAAGGIESDCARIEYADAASLYLPVHRMNLIEPYSGESDAPATLDKLGGTGWATSVAKARKVTMKIAKELVELYAARKVFDGYKYPEPDSTYREFEATFPYEETPDQSRAISDVLSDLTSLSPMDRLICGDVGYGKTEVALRAAFVAAMEGKQVALLVPTTLLAHQHFRTFRQRLEPYPLRVEMVSRLRTSAQIKAILRDLKDGKVDIIIGTHRLVQKDVHFCDLGLLIIDEEHRFGVKHKEKIKEIKKLVDVMTLTATPIPRTLQLSLLGIWDMSTIDTPPPDRLAVRTKVVAFDEDIIRDAIGREISRGGQVYFVAPRIKNLDGIARLVRELAPDVRMGIAHGQLKENELERIMIEFIEGRLDVLLCTSIIESGIDIPKANTILIYNAHNFGLATLYQLRGRVGRSQERAYAYLMVPGKLLLSRRARERLRALEEFSELGSGYRIARLDLKIRGAGNILGEDQSGPIHRIGYDLYLDLLQKAIRALKGEDVKEEIEPEIFLSVEAYLPEDYVPDPQERVVLYRRLSRALSETQLVDLKGELLDRFGPIPSPTDALLGIISMKNVLRAAQVKSLRREGRTIRLSFAPGAPVVPGKIVALANEDVRKYKLAPDDEFLFNPSSQDISSLVQETSDILKRIVERDTIVNCDNKAQID